MAKSITVKEQFLQDINTQLLDISSIDPRIVIQEKTYSRFADVTDLRVNIQASIGLFKELMNSNLEELPVSVLENIRAESANFIVLISGINDFKPDEDSNPIQKVKGYIEQATRTHSGLFSTYLPIINRSKNSVNRFKSYETKLKKALDDSKKFVELFEKSSKNILDDIKDKAAKIVVVKYAEYFNTEANNHRRGAYGWLIGGIIFFLTAFVFGYYYNEILVISKTASISEIVQNTVIKLVLISVILSGIALCVKNYKANRHNYIIYKHKVNALATFELFRDAAEGDESTKNVILIQAAQSIFSIPNTGYISSETDSHSSNKFIEIVRNVGEKTQTKG